MANTITPTYSFTLPEVGAATNAWGGYLNDNFTKVDQQMVSRTLTSAQTLLGAINLPSNGLNVGSGQLRVTGGNVTASGTLTVTGAIASSSDVSGVNGSFSGTLAVTSTATLSGNTTVGGTFGVTGAVTFSSTATASFTPTTGSHLTNKTYVDGQLNTKADTTTTITGTGALTGGGSLAANRTIDVVAGGIGSTQLASNSVTTVKIVDGNVTTSKIADSNVTTAKIADSNVTASKLSGGQTGSAPIFGARAWGAISNNGTVSIAASGNIASVSRAAIGIVDVNFSTAMTDTNYSVSATSFSSVAFSSPCVINKATTAFRIRTNTGAGDIDMDFSFVVFR